MGISIPEVPFSGSMGDCRLLKGLKIVCGKRTTFLRIKNIPTGRSCRPSWGASVWCPGDRDVSVLQSGRRDARWIRCYRCVGHHLFPDRTDPGNTDPSGKRYLSYLSRAGNNIKCCCPWRCQLFAVSGKPSVTDILEQKHWITQQLFR